MRSKVGLSHSLTILDWMEVGVEGRVQKKRKQKEMKE